MKKVVLILALFGVVIAGLGSCSFQPDDAYINSGYKFRFDFPAGWSRLTFSEKRSLFPGERHLLSVADPDRKAFIILVGLGLIDRSMDSLNFVSELVVSAIGSEFEDLSPLTKQLVARYTVLTHGLTVKMEKKYNNFKIHKDGFEKIKGWWVRDIVSEGTLKGKHNWRRTIIFIPKLRNDEAFLLFMACSTKELDRYKPFFDDMLDSWIWE